MINEFINLVTRLFPAIDPYTAEQAIASLRVYRERGKSLKFTQTKPFEILTQGDVIETILFTSVDDTGELRRFWKPGMLISNTCDMEHDPNLLVALCYSIEELVGMGFDRSAIVNNTINQLFYIPDIDLVVDLSVINSMSTKLLDRLISEGRVTKKSSLSIFGFYFLLAKLTVHFMRPEDIGVSTERKNDWLDSGCEII